MQKIKVKFNDDPREYTYLWDGKDPVEVGDHVETPVPYWITGPDRHLADPGVAVVCALGSDYEGTMTVLRNRA